VREKNEVRTERAKRTIQPKEKKIGHQTSRGCGQEGRNGRKNGSQCRDHEENTWEQTRSLIKTCQGIGPKRETLGSTNESTSYDELKPMQGHSPKMKAIRK